MDINNELLTFAEQCVRQVYFRSAQLRKLRGGPRQAESRDLDLSEFCTLLRDVGMGEGDNVMVHAALSKVRVLRREDKHRITNAIDVAEEIIKAIRSVIGESGTMLMPAFPKYKNEPEYFASIAVPHPLQFFDPNSTKSKSGVLSEVFRTLPNTLRSEFPIQTVCAQGPLAEFFVDGNIDLGNGLAHGENSPYGRLVRRRSYVFSIGIPLIDYATVIHAPEDARFAEWPFRNFWRDRWFEVARAGGREKVRVRERDPRFSRGYAEERIRRDLRAAGILKERMLGSVEIHSMRADQMFDFFMSRNANSTYPYFWPKVSLL